MLSYELLTVAAWSVVSLVMCCGVLLGRFRFLSLGNCVIVIKETPLRRTLFTFLQLLVFLLMFAALGVDSWSLYAHDHGTRHALDAAAEIVTLGALATRSSYDNEQRALYRCTAVSSTRAAGEKSHLSPLDNSDRCQTVQISGALLLCWGILSVAVSLVLFVCVRCALQLASLSERARRRLSAALPRLCSAQLLCLQAVLIVWLGGGEEPLLVAQSELRGMGVPLLGTSFVLATLAVAAAVPVSLFYTDKDSSLHLPFSAPNSERPVAEAPASLVSSVAASADAVAPALSQPQQLHAALLRAVHRNEPLPPELLERAATQFGPVPAPMAEAQDNAAAEVSENASPQPPIRIESASVEQQCQRSSRNAADSDEDIDSMSGELEVR